MLVADVDHAETVSLVADRIRNGQGRDHEGGGAVPPAGAQPAEIGLVDVLHEERRLRGGDPAGDTLPHAHAAPQSLVLRDPHGGDQGHRFGIGTRHQHRDAARLEVLGHEPHQRAVEIAAVEHAGGGLADLVDGRQTGHRLRQLDVARLQVRHQQAVVFRETVLLEGAIDDAVEGVDLR